MPATLNSQTIALANNAMQLIAQLAALMSRAI